MTREGGQPQSQRQILSAAVVAAISYRRTAVGDRRYRIVRSAVARTEVNIIGMGFLAIQADFHEHQANSPVRLILTEPLPQMESALDGRDVVAKAVNP